MPLTVESRGYLYEPDHTEDLSQMETERVYEQEYGSSMVTIARLYKKALFTIE